MDAEKLPTRLEIIEMLDRLIAGEVTRAEASHWATPFILDDGHRVDDDAAWDVLTSLVGADLVSTDRPFLYGEDDFRQWREQLV